MEEHPNIAINLVKEVKTIRRLKRKLPFVPDCTVIYRAYVIRA